MLGGNKRKMGNQRGNNRKNFNSFNNSQQSNFNNQLQDNNNSGFMDFSNNFNDQQQQQQRPQNNMNNKRKMNGQQNNRSPNKKMNFQNGNNNKNWNNQQQRRVPQPQMMNQQNQFQQFNSNPPPPMNQQRMPPVNFRNNNLRNNNGGPMNFPPMQQQRRGPPQMNMPQRGPPIGAIPPPLNMRGNGSGGPPRRPFPKFPNNNQAPNRNNKPNLTKVDKPKNRKPPVTVAKKNGGNRGKKRQRDPYSLEAPFVNDEIREEHKKKEDILESLKGKGKNDELFAKFKEQREIFVKKYDEVKAAYQAEKKVSLVGDCSLELLVTFNRFYCRLNVKQPRQQKQRKLLRRLKLRKRTKGLW